jgi:hypothetical protein
MPNLGLVCITTSDRVRYRTMTRKRLLQLSDQQQRRALEELYSANLARLNAAIDFCEEQEPAGQRQKTNNHVERMNRRLRFDEKARYKWRKRRSIVRFILLRISRHTPRPKIQDQQPPPEGGG